MARKVKEKPSKSTPSWLITFSDMMTLLLTFFVLLLSMSVIDERHKIEVIGAVAREFSFESSIPNRTAPKGDLPLMEPGKMDGNDFEVLRDKIFDAENEDLHFQENKYVQIFSINDEVLFLSGSTALSEKGKQLLNTILPYLQQIPYPLLVAGHTALRRDEEGPSYRVTFGTQHVESTWKLSMQRALTVYSHLTSNGIPPTRLSLEGFAQFKPRFSSNTPKGRQQNRRVDLVLDKRNLDWIEKVEGLKEKLPSEIRDHYFKGFKFDLTMPGATLSIQGRN